ncbi:Mrp/NBP35 family ATP-binding protein [Clostridioides mangenotii]|uniref:Mrp/NBP35 family ATP-binding protein n=1 Tax=Metaclostridioides mangenotii TaxID=1540 RepID=UPI001C104804|nr:Mrp/NBP35 family ATP-binding protein [Clostridioides mangenotii]MBU5308325.1 Mrp/NBP35 family ATP-binding protein [Clostridioides mangenotii]MCR1954656.1 Mrp/NBP35 family ATP-binding protein [Clostridioides mangenotii]
MSNCDSCPSRNKCSTKDTGCSIINNPDNNIKNIIGIMSGKGGVGKSTVTSLIAKKLNSMGYKVGILDSDITGPSIPRLMGLKNLKAYSDGKNIIPVTNSDNIKIMSINLLIENENDPMILKGPLIGNLVNQFYTDVLWGELDYLLIDMPPGTGDVALTVMQNIPLSGVVMVSVPQDLISMIVSKAVNMARKLNIDVLGVVENMSYIKCPDCDNKIKLFDGEETDKFLSDMNLSLLGELPMTKEIINITHNGINEMSEDLNSTITDIVNKIK